MKEKREGGTRPGAQLGQGYELERDFRLKFHLLGLTALPPFLHIPAFVTVQSIEEMRSSVRHRGAGELKEQASATVKPSHGT